ncbi:MAG: glycosyltransferase family 4 protein [Nitrospirae bacterium]|nr:glycosyltransferase family 4 protein [Nitrospirota bacterium]
MKILLAASSKFHAFHLASQLDRRGHLGLFLTSFYSRASGILWKWVRRVDAEAITPSRVRIMPWVEATRGLDRLPRAAKRALGMDYTDYWYHPRHFLFDLWVSRFVDRTYDLVVGWAEHSLFTMRKAHRLGIPFVLYSGTAHNGYRWPLLTEEFAKWGLDHKLPPQVLARSLKEYDAAKHLSVVSSYAERTFSERGFAANAIIRVVPGVDATRFRSHPKSDSVFRMIYAGLMRAGKGIPYLLEAWRKIRPKSAELWLIGSVYDEMRPVLERYRNHFIYKPRVPQAELPGLLSQADVFALPTLDEGFAAVQLQAMSCGLPLLTTTNSGGEDVVCEGREGFVVPIRDSDALAEKIDWFATHPDETRRMGRSAARAAAGFTWDRYGDRIVASYGALI